MNLEKKSEICQLVKWIEVLLLMSKALMLALCFTEDGMLPFNHICDERLYLLEPLQPSLASHVATAGIVIKCNDYILNYSYSYYMISNSILKSFYIYKTFYGIV